MCAEAQAEVSDASMLQLLRRLAAMLLRSGEGLLGCCPGHNVL